MLLKLCFLLILAIAECSREIRSSGSGWQDISYSDVLGVDRSAEGDKGLKYWQSLKPTTRSSWDGQGQSSGGWGTYTRNTGFRNRFLDNNDIRSDSWTGSGYTGVGWNSNEW